MTTTFDRFGYTPYLRSTSVLLVYGRLDHRISLTPPSVKRSVLTLSSLNERETYLSILTKNGCAQFLQRPRGLVNLQAVQGSSTEHVYLETSWATGSLLHICSGILMIQQQSARRHTMPPRSSLQENSLSFINQNIRRQDLAERMTKIETGAWPPSNSRLKPPPRLPPSATRLSRLNVSEAPFLYCIKSRPLTTLAQHQPYLHSPIIVSGRRLLFPHLA